MKSEVTRIANDWDYSQRNHTLPHLPDADMNYLIEQAKLAELFLKVEHWALKGISIEYIIIDQIENGFQKLVEKGEMPPVTYTSSVLVREDDSNPFAQSYDSLIEALSDAVKFVEGKFN